MLNVAPVFAARQTHVALTRRRPCVLWNSTDNLQAVPGRFLTYEDATQAASAFRARFAIQGYYKTADGDRIPPEEIRLYLLDPKAIPKPAMFWPGQS